MQALVPLLFLVPCLLMMVMRKRRKELDRLIDEREQDARGTL